MTNPEHPGAVLREEMRERGISHMRMASLLHLSARELWKIVYRGAPVTPELAVRIADLLGTSAEFWLRMQQAWDEGRM